MSNKKYLNASKLLLSALMALGTINVSPVHAEPEADDEPEVVEGEQEQSEEVAVETSGEDEVAVEEPVSNESSDDSATDSVEPPVEETDSLNDDGYTGDGEPVSNDYSDETIVDDEITDDELIETEEPEVDFSEDLEEETVEFVDNDPELYGFDFSSKRLLVITSDSSVFTDDMPIIAEYDGLYLLQFSTIKDAQEAYEYLVNRVDMVEPDIEFEADEGDEPESDPQGEVSASDSTDAVDPNAMTEEENPLTVLSAEMDAIPEVIEETKSDNQQYVIALIDTGAHQDGNVIASVSMIGESGEDDNGHGSKMVSYIVAENPNAQILSIKALDDKGKGSTSAIYAALEYAIEQNVDIINLSLSAFSNADNAIIADEIKKAAELGIMVVGSAGNRGMDVRYFIPGNIHEATIATSATSDYQLNGDSNFGDTVDYMVIANSGSEAAARLSGKMSASLYETGHHTTSLSDGVRSYDLVMHPEEYQFTGEESGEFTTDGEVVPFWEVGAGTTNILRFDEGVLSRNPNAKKYMYDYVNGSYNAPKTVDGTTVSTEWAYNATSARVKPTKAIALWAPDAGMYFDESFGMEVIIEGLDKGDSNTNYWQFNYFPAKYNFAGLWVEGFKLYKVSVNFYHNVPAGSTKPAGDPLKMETQAGYIYLGPTGLTHEGVIPAATSMHVEESEFSSPIPADEKMYTYLDNEHGAYGKEWAVKRYGNSSGNPSSAYADIMMYYSVFNNGINNTPMQYNSAFYQDIKDKTGVEFYIGITGTLDLNINAQKVGNPNDFRYSDPTIWWQIDTISNWYQEPTQPTEIPDPDIVKYVYNRADKEWYQDTLELKDGDEFDYKVSIELPGQTEGGWYSALKITDTFDELIDLSGITTDSFHVEDDEGNDVSDLFAIAFDPATRTVTATAGETLLERHASEASPYYQKFYHLIGTGFKKIENANMTPEQITAFSTTYGYKVPNKAKLEWTSVFKNLTNTTSRNGSKDSNNVYVHYDHWLKINYLEQGTRKVLYTQYVDPTRSYGLTYSVVSPDLKDGTKLICDNPNNYGYSLVDEAQATVAGTMPSDYYEIDVFYYPHKLVINYLEEGTNVVLWKQYVDPSKTTDEAYSVKSPVIDGYVLTDEGFATVSGTMNAPIKEHTVYYRKTPMIGDKVTVYKTAEPASETYVNKGGTIVYTLTAKNTGAYASNSFKIMDNIPEGTTYVSCSDGGTYDASTNTVTWSGLSLAKGAEKSVKLTVKVNNDNDSFVYNSAHWQYTGGTDTKTVHQTNETIHRITGSDLTGPAALESVKGTSVETTRHYKILEGNTTSTTVYWHQGMQPFTWKAPIGGNYTYTITNGKSTSGTYSVSANQDITIAGSGTPSATRIVLNDGGKAVIKLPLVSNTISQTYGSNGGVQTYKVPSNAIGNASLTLEVWGSQGYVNSETTGTPKNKGGYAKGNYSAAPGTTLYVVVGHRGSGWDSPGYNGGGRGGGAGAAGGGATHIALETGTLATLRSDGKDNKVLIVAGGGGGVGTGYSSKLNWSKIPNDGAYGGGTRGGRDYDSNKYPTQTAGAGKGQGENTNTWGQPQCSGGGGGWWGGYGDNPTKNSNNWATGWYSYGGGGSGYIGGVTGGTMSNNVREGSGQAKITGSYNSQGTQTAPTTRYQDVVVTAAGSGPIELGGVVTGQTITYTVTLSNNGGANSIGTVLTDEIPAGTTFVNGSISKNTSGSITGAGNPTYNATTKRVEWYLGTMAPNASATLTFKVTANTGAYLVQNQARFARGIANAAEMSSTNPMHASNIVEHIVTGSLPVVKQWIGDQESDRPANITVHLVSTDGTVDKTATLNAGNGWQTNFTGLDTSKTYNIYEDVPSGYTSSAGGAGNAKKADFSRSNMITNTKIPPQERSITVIKHWVGSSDLPASVILHVKGSDGSHYQHTVTAADNWSHTFTGLPVKNGNTDIVYSVYETSANGVKSNMFVYQYEGEANAVTVPAGTDPQEVVITNTAVTTIDIPVTKKWVPVSEGSRYDSIQLGLYDGTTLIQQITLYKANGWEGRFVNIPTQTSSGDAIDISNYTVKEIGTHPRYTATVSGSATDADGFTVTNEKTTKEKYKHALIQKNWVGDGEDGRPSEINVTIFGSDGSVYNVKLTKANGWKLYKVLPAETEDGTDIVYSLSESAVISTASILKGFGSAGSLVASDFTNANMKFGRMSGSGGDGEVSLVAAANSPSGSNVYRIANNTTGNTYVAQTEMPYENGQSYVYSGYVRSIGSSPATAVVREWNSTQNSFISEASLSISLTDNEWHYFEKTYTYNAANADNVNFEFGVTGAGSVEFAGVKLVKANSIAYTSSAPASAPVSLKTVTTEVADGQAITRPTEAESTYTTAITNTIKPNMVTIKKIWKGEDGDLSMRPASITLHIDGSDGSSITKTLNGTAAQSEWSDTYEIPRYAADGSPITYTIWESPIDGYDGPSAANDGIVAQYSSSTRSYYAELENELVLDYPVEKKVFNDDDEDINEEVVLDGDTLHYVIYVTNPMSSTKKFDIEDTVPANSTYIANSANLGGSYDSASKKITWTGVEIAGGETKEIKFNVTAVGQRNTWTEIHNAANTWMQRADNTRNARTEKETNEVVNYIALYPGEGNGSLKTVTDSAGTDINTKYVEKNDVLYYHITVENKAPVSKEFTITDTIPANSEFVQVYDDGTYASGKVTWVKTIPARGSTEVTFTVRATQFASDIINKAHISVDHIEWDTNEVENKTAQIVINKALSNYHESYGSPAFIYKIVGSDGSVAYRMIEITNQASGSATFEVPRYTASDVTYTVEELRNARYEFESVATTTTDTTTVTASNPRGSVAFSKDHRSSVFNYKNKINDWMKATHADSVTNAVGSND